MQNFLCSDCNSKIIKNQKQCKKCGAELVRKILDKKEELEEEEKEEEKEKRREYMTEEEQTINSLEEKVKELNKKNNKLENTSGRLGVVIFVLLILMVRSINSNTANKEKSCFDVVETLENNIREANITNIDLDTFFDSDQWQNGRNCYNEEYD